MDSNSVEFLNGDPLDELKQACFLFHNNISGNARYFRSSSINDTTASIESNGKKADDNSEDEKQFVSKLDFTKPKEVLFPSKLINNLPQIPKISDAYSAQVHPQAIIPSHPIAPHYPILYSHVDASTHPHSISFLETKVRDLPRSSSTSRYPEQTHKSNRSQEERYQDYQYHSDDNYQKQQKVSQTDTRPKKDDVMKMFVPPMVRLMLSCLGDFKKLKINPDFKYLSAIGRCIFDRVYNEDLKEYLISFLELQLGHQVWKYPIIQTFISEQVKP